MSAASVSRGGWRTWWNHRVPRRVTLGNLNQRLDRFERQALQPAWSGKAVALAAGVAVVHVVEISPSRHEGCRRRRVSRVVLPSSA